MTVKVDLIGKKKEDGTVISCTQDITDFLIEDAKIALVPFASFGASADSTWYRVSVGTCTLEQINEVMNSLHLALSKLK
jgi:aspartate aminotransferase